MRYHFEYGSKPVSFETLGVCWEPEYMRDKIIRDKQGDEIGSIEDAPPSDTGDFVTDNEGIMGVGLVIGALVGGYKGFMAAGVGGAIVGIVIGGFVGAWVLAFLFYALMWALVVGLGVGVIALIIWIIHGLWGVGKP